MDFLIFYEHVNREIENDTLLKYELERRGYTCDIIHFAGPGLHKYHKQKNRAKVLVTPWLRYNVDVLEYLHYAKRPYKLVNLQWEQVYSKRGVECGLVATHDEAKKAYHLCWGENSRARLEEMGVPKENLAIVGAMQQDYGRPIFDNYYLSREDISNQFGLDKDKPWLLFVSSLAYATYPENALKSLAEKFGDGIYGTAKLHKETQEKILNWIEELLKVSDCEFIYRPHPSERLAPRLSEMSEKYAGFHVISDMSVKQWAKVSDKVNLWISTSNAEIASLGIDYSIIRPIPVDREREVESMYDETFVESVEDFIRVNTEEIENSKENAKRRLLELERFYNYDTEKPAYVRVADFLEEVYRSDRVAGYHFGWKESLKARIKEWKTRQASLMMERSLKKQDYSFIDRMPIKHEIKNNLHKALEKHEQKIKTEEKMMGYLKENG